MLRTFIDDEDLGPVDQNFGILNLLIDFENVFRTIFLPGRMPQLVSLVNQGARRLTDYQAMALVVFLYHFVKTGLRDSLGPGVWLKDVGDKHYLGFRPLEYKGVNQDSGGLSGYSCAQLFGSPAGSGVSLGFSY